MKFDFRTAAVTIEEGIVTAIFSDGKVNEFNTHWADRGNYRDIARDMGFRDDWQHYALTHELTHHWVADRLGWNWSWAVHDDIHYEGEMPAHIAWEEHIVNKLQRLVMSGQEDEHGVLQALFEPNLRNVQLELAALYARVK